MQNSDLTIGDKIRAGIPALTSLRFFAALSVLLFHFGASAGASVLPLPILNVLRSGYLGVTFFFILSGFILTCSYRGRVGEIYIWKKYWISRFARVYPVYLLGLILVLPFSKALNTTPSISAIFLVQSWTLPASHLGTDWNMPAWTLSIELFFYLIFPVALGLSSKLNRAWLLTLMLTSAALIALFDLSAIAPGAKLSGTLQYIPLPILRLPEFLLGIAMAQFLLFYRNNLPPKWADAAIAASATLTIALMAAPHHAPGIISIGFACIIFSAALSQGFLATILSNRILVVLGGASYAIYLFQMGIHAAMDEIFNQNETMARLSFPLAIGLRPLK